MKARFSLRAAWNGLHYYGGLFFFGVGIGLLQLVSVAGMVLPTGPRLRRGVRGCIRRYLRLYFVYLRGVGALRGEWAGWQERFATEPGIIVANHPSMLDAPFFLSRLSQGVCIFKAALGRNVMRGRAATMTGYIHSEEGVDGLRSVIEAVRGGAQFVFFPEGTRTTATNPIHLRPLYAVVAKYAQAPIHVFTIERNSNALCKDHVLRRCPILPARFVIRHVETVRPEAAPTAALLHARVAATLGPIIEAHRRPVSPEAFAWKEVVEESGERVEWRLRLAPGEGFFAGHFPGHPIAPGAASLHWIQAAWAAGPGAGQAPAQLQRVRFQREIQPGTEVRLRLERRAGGWKATLETAEGPATTATLLPGTGA